MLAFFLSRLLTPQFLVLAFTLGWAVVQTTPYAGLAATVVTAVYLVVETAHQVATGQTPGKDLLDELGQTIDDLKGQLHNHQHPAVADLAPLLPQIIAALTVTPQDPPAAPNIGVPVVPPPPPAAPPMVSIPSVQVIGYLPDAVTTITTSASVPVNVPPPAAVGDLANGTNDLAQVAAPTPGSAVAG